MCFYPEKQTQDYRYKPNILPKTLIWHQLLNSYTHPSFNAGSVNTNFKSRKNIICTKTQSNTFIMGVNGKIKFVLHIFTERIIYQEHNLC